VGHLGAARGLHAGMVLPLVGAALIAIIAVPIEMRERAR
jgi:hypothetical protein